MRWGGGGRPAGARHTAGAFFPSRGPGPSRSRPRCEAQRGSAVVWVLGAKSENGVLSQLAVVAAAALQLAKGLELV